MSNSSNDAGWQVVHVALMQLATARCALDYEEACLLAAAKRLRLHEQFGYGSLLEYVTRTLGHQERVARDRLRVAEALEDLPLTAAALRDGTMSWSAIRELTRVAVLDTEAEWLEAAYGRTVRQIEEMTSGILPGGRPNAERREEAMRHTLRFEINGATLALFREAQAQLIRESGHGLTEDDVLQLMARRVLAGRDTDKERGSSYQIAVTVCESCKRAKQEGGGRAIVMSKEELTQAECDAHWVGDPSTEDTARATQDVAPATRRKVKRRDGGRCVVDGCTQSIWLDIHHLTWRTDGGGHDAENLIMLCSAHHTAIHEGRLLVEGRPSMGLSFRHADGASYGLPTWATIEALRIGTPHADGTKPLTPRETTDR
jgi:hypothetical protein